MSEPVIVWYRNDLRVTDHAALDAASRSGRPLIPVYIFDDGLSTAPQAGGATRWWLHHGLTDLDRALRELGSRLLIREGDSVAILEDMAREHKALAIHFLHHHEPEHRRVEFELHDRLGDRLELRGFEGRLLYDPKTVATASGDPFRVFTPFWKACLRQSEPRAPLAAPTSLSPPPAGATGLDIEELNLLPQRPDWAAGLREHWTPGEDAAGRLLNTFVDDAMARYPQRRDLPGDDGTSQLSPHLHFGELSVLQVWHAVRARQSMDSSATRGGDAFLRELGWREFCHHLLLHWPEISQRGFNPRYDDFPWRDDAPAFDAWSRGRTGYPLVDAGMHQLWHSGWMHNRVRMVCASFLVKHLLIPWQRGEAWFRDTLVDADLANNICGWQWVAGCGADAAPYFRIFNPVLQGEKFDPRGDYVRAWVPELSRLPDRFIHRPFDAPPALLSSCGIRLGETYPTPLVEHGFARRRALDALESIKN